MTIEQLTPIDAPTLALVQGERQKALSPREWKFRLRGHGFAIKDVDGAQLLTRLPKGDAVGFLPPEMA